MKKQSRDPRYKEINTRKSRLYTTENYKEVNKPNMRFYAIKVSIHKSSSDMYFDTDSVFLNNNIVSSVLFDDYILAKIAFDKYLRTLDKDSKIREATIIQLSGTFSTIEKLKQELQ